MSDEHAIGLVVAALGGAAVGLERQWSGHADGPRARFAGIRTFTLLGIIGGLCGVLSVDGLIGPATVLLLGAMALIAVAYRAASRKEVDATTEVAALVVVATGVIAGSGNYRVASGVVAATSLLLVEKSRLHSLVASIDDIGLRAAVRFAVMALVVLPLLPEGPYGPFGGVRPRELWALVLFFSGLSFAGYLARRVMGARTGLLVTGLLGGLISSTNVTFTFARTSRREPAVARTLAYGAVAANAMLYPRVALAVGILRPALIPLTVPMLVAPWSIATGVAVWGARRGAEGEPAEAMPARNPLDILSALQMAFVFQVVLMTVHLVQRAWGDAGVLTSAAVLGLTDVDALTVTMTRGVENGASTVAALGIGAGVMANTALKGVLAVSLGRGAFRSVAGGTLAAMTGAAALSLFLLR